MDEQEVRDALRTYVSNRVPPSSVDAAGLVAAGRHGRRRRIAAVTASAAVFAVMGVVTTVTALATPRGPDQPAASPPAPSAPVPPVEVCPDGPPTRAPKSPRLTCHLRNAVLAKMPGATLSLPVHIPGSTFDIRGTVPLQAIPRWNEPPGKSLTEEQLTTPGPDDGVADITFNAEAVVNDRHGAGTIFFLVGDFEPVHRNDAIETCRRQLPGPCEVRTGPAGQTILVRSTPGTRGQLNHHVTVYFGHTIVAGNVSNTVRRELRGPSSPTRPEPPLTVDALIEIATLPELLAFG